MVNYEFIGARLREARLRKKLSQEQLAAMVDVGTSHISHIETGVTIPSTKLLVQLMNILNCDPNEVLCMETRSTRPILNSWLSELVADCTEDEIKIITDTVMVYYIGKCKKLPSYSANKREEHTGSRNRFEAYAQQ